MGPGKRALQVSPELMILVSSFRGAARFRAVLAAGLLTLGNRKFDECLVDYCVEIARPEPVRISYYSS
jgi:hypothetical protein